MTSPSLTDRFAAEMGRLLGPEFPSDLGIAVSGGGDSMALLHLAAGWARPMGVRLWVVTIDHGLRKAAGEEAALVADEAAGLGLVHATLKWQGWDGTGNLQDAARQARLKLIGSWRGAARDVLFGHTLDDQAETVLMRLARGSGVEGLSAMASVRQMRPDFVPLPTHSGTLPTGAPADGPWRMIRPLLEISRAELRHYCGTLRIPFVDDPTNEDQRFDRVRVRQALDVLDTLGISRARLAETAGRMGRARDALEARATEARDRCLLRAHYDVAFDRDTFAGFEADTQLRLLANALCWIGLNPYRPRAEPLEALLDRLLAGGGGTLHGAHAVATSDTIAIGREWAAVRHMRCAQKPPELWDDRWSIGCDGHPSGEIAALGEDGLVQIAQGADASPRPIKKSSVSHDLPQWALNDPRAIASPPRALLAGCPAIWEGGRLVACTAAGWGEACFEALRHPFGPFRAYKL